MKKMLENIGILENMAIEESNFTAMRFIRAFRALEWVRKSCFCTLLGNDWSEEIVFDDEINQILVTNTSLQLTQYQKLDTVWSILGSETLQHEAAVPDVKDIL